jgi:nicotinamidase/pyrazinamidase
MSFASNHPGRAIGDVVESKGMSQVLWPDHCVQESKGSAFHPTLETTNIHRIFYKGSDKSIESYSAFFDNAHLRATGLGDYLRDLEVETVYIMGLATDYCVKFSALDALHLNFKVVIIQDGCRGVNLKPSDSDQAFADMQAAGVTLINSMDIVLATQ